MTNQQGRRPTTAPPVHGSSEYSQSYATTRHAPRPRNPIPSWGSRNRSDVLPTAYTQIHPRIPNNTTNLTPRQRPRRPPQRWPWQERAARSEIFQNPRVPDVNNNPSIPVRPLVQAPQRWPWQRRAHSSSSVFLFGRGDQEQNMAPPPPPRSQPKWPWQERAAQSKVFEGVEEKLPTHKTYQWDQRKSHLFAQEQEQDEPQPSSSQGPSKKDTFPWQKKAQQSTIFSSPDPIHQSGMKYPWDQRQSAFDVKFDSNIKFEAVSRYQHDFISNKVDTKNIEAAGKPCYGIINGIADFHHATVPPQTTETLGGNGNHGRPEGPEPLELSKLNEDLRDAFQPHRRAQGQDEIKTGHSHGDNPSTAAAGKKCYESENSQRTCSYKSTRCNSKEKLTQENLQRQVIPDTQYQNHVERLDFTDVSTAEKTPFAVSNNESRPLTSKILGDRTNEITSALEDMQITPVKEEIPISITKIITPKITARKDRSFWDPDPKNKNVVILDLTEEN